jgi:hypothetical protein
MPTQVGIHEFVSFQPGSRGWRAFARHDDARLAEGSRINLLVYSFSLTPARTVAPGVWYPFTGSNLESKTFVPFA